MRTGLRVIRLSLGELPRDSSIVAKGVPGGIGHVAGSEASHLANLASATGV